jgi:hypothetical protein
MFILKGSTAVPRASSAKAFSTTSMQAAMSSTDITFSRVSKSAIIRLLSHLGPTRAEMDLLKEDTRFSAEA